MADDVLLPSPMVEIDTWLGMLMRPSSLVEMAALLACVLVAWLVVWLIRRTMHEPRDFSVLIGRRLVDGVLFPFLLLCMAEVARVLLAKFMSPHVFKFAIPVLVSLLVIRVGVKVLQVAFKEAPLVRVLERSISWVAWVAVVLWLTGILPVMLEELDQISWKMGGGRMSLRTLIEGVLTAGAVLILSLWISSAIEARLLRSATGGELSLRKAVSNATRALLMFVGFLMAMSTVGIDLTALSVLGGAIGVGVGFGLQKLASNYVSGFVILAERSMRIGDMVKVDNFEGVVTDIKTRYTLIRALNGRESVVPNELIITQRVENLSLADPEVVLQINVTVGYDSDVAQVEKILLGAAASCDRVLKTPAPSAYLLNFGADGLEYTLSMWIADPQSGQYSLRSEINNTILRDFRLAGIDIPYPQRVIHTL